MDRTRLTLTVLVLLALALALGGGGSIGPLVPSKPTAVTYVHEQRVGSITPAIRAALSTLNSKGITATEFDVDTVSKGGGGVPLQYVVPLAAAKTTGLPSAVSTSGDRVIKAIPNPKAEDILALAP